MSQFWSPSAPSSRCFALGAVVLTLTLVGCTGATEAGPEIVVNGDDCSYEGSTELTAGPATVVLQLRNLGHSAVTVVRLGEDRDYAELVAHYASSTEPIPDPPPWAGEIVHFELEQEGGEGKGASRVVTLTEGSYGVVCIDHWGFAADGPSAEPVAEVTVNPARAS